MERTTFLNLWDSWLHICDIICRKLLGILIIMLGFSYILLAIPYRTAPAPKEHALRGARMSIMSYGSSWLSPQNEMTASKVCAGYIEKTVCSSVPDSLSFEKGCNISRGFSDTIALQKQRLVVSVTTPVPGSTEVFTGNTNTAFPDTSNDKDVTAFPDTLSNDTDETLRDTFQTLYPEFVLDANGYVVSCYEKGETIPDGLLVLPPHSDCTGVAAGAFDGLGDMVTELCIPGNITYIDADALNSLENLMYIEVLDGNPSYYSENGCLYDISGNMILCPWN